MDSSTYLPIARLSELTDDVPAHAAVDGIDLVLVRRIPVQHADGLEEGMKALFAADGPALLHVHTDAELV